MSRFLERLLEEPVIVADGGLGALVASRVARVRCPEEANLSEPETVLALQLGFVRAGAKLIATNTFGASRHKLRAHLLDDRLEEIVERGARIAREAREVSGEPLLIGGSIGPLGDFEGRLGTDERAAMFAEQARLLDGRGVDLFLVETFVDLAELALAVEAVRSVSALPIVAQLAFDEGGETLAGVRAGRAVIRASELGAAAVGTNCGLGPVPRSRRSRRWPRRPGPATSPSPPSRTSGCRPGAAGAWCFRARRPTTSPSSRPRRARSGPASSGRAAAPPPPRLRQSRRRSKTSASRACAWRRPRARTLPRRGEEPSAPGSKRSSPRASGSRSWSSTRRKGRISTRWSRRQPASPPPGPSTPSTSTTTRWPAPG